MISMLTVEKSGPLILELRTPEGEVVLRGTSANDRIYLPLPLPSLPHHLAKTAAFHKYNTGEGCWEMAEDHEVWCVTGTLTKTEGKVRPLYREKKKVGCTCRLW